MRGVRGNEEFEEEKNIIQLIHQNKYNISRGSTCIYKRRKRKCLEVNREENSSEREKNHGVALRIFNCRPNVVGLA